METPPQLVQQILFNLDRLAETNGHHEYEKICFAFARRRVSINLLPATGPVSAGGDQGRDAESFWSNIANEISATSVHAATVSGERVVLACTIQKTAIPSKIRSDLSSITGQGTPVGRVLYFTVASVPVARRHKLIAQARTEHKVELEIFDGLALAEHLADPDLFWIAAEYLKLPASLAPERSDEDDPLPDWYVRDRDYWRARTDPGRSMGDLVGLRDVLRHATYHDQARGDLGDWIAKMREFLTGKGPVEVQIRARYEIAVATLRGTGELHAADPLVREFFQSITDIDDDLPLLEDACVLLQYGYGSRLRGTTGITMAELDSYYEMMRTYVHTALADNPYPNAKALLLAIDVRLVLFQAYPKDLPERIEGLRDPRDTLRLVLDAYDADEPVPAQKSAFPLRDRDAGMATLGALLDVLPSAPLFPIEHTAELFEMLTLSLADHPEYAALRDRLDDAVARVGGDASKAARAHARAITFAGAGQLLRALAEVHEAKIGWRHGETIEDSIPMMLLAASIYEHLGLFFAAKLHAVAATVAANVAPQTDVRRFVPQAVSVAAINDFKAGNWCSASRLVRVALLAQNAYAEDPTNLDRHAYLADVLQREAFALHVARSLAPHYEPPIRITAQEMGTETLLDDLASQLASGEHRTIETLVQALDRQGFGRPFADAGATRDLRWTAFGAAWNVRSRNTRRDTLAAERLASGIQIIQAELALADAVWLPAEIHIEVKTDRDERPTGAENLERMPDNDLSRWVVHLQPGDSVQEDRALVDLVTDASLLLLDNSLLDREKFLTLVDDAFARGLGHKLSGGRPYDEAANFLRDEDYERMAALPPGPVGEGIVRDVFPEHPELALRTDLSEWYDHVETVANIERRYERMMPIGRVTIPRLARTEPTATVLRQLSDEGWRDWQLIMAITNIIGNARPAWEGLRVAVDSPPDVRARASALLRREELDTDPQLGSDAFTRDKLLPALEFTALLTLPSYGLHLNTSTPNAAAVLTVLRDRFNFGVDDAEHDDLLAGPHGHGDAG
jgi:hypothetical protein